MSSKCGFRAGNALLEGLKAGTVKVSNAIDAAPAVAETTVVNYID